MHSGWCNSKSFLRNRKQCFCREASIELPGTVLSSAEWFLSVRKGSRPLLNVGINLFRAFRIDFQFVDESFLWICANIAFELGPLAPISGFGFASL